MGAHGYKRVAGTGRKVPELHILTTPEDAAQSLAEFVAALAEKQVKAQDRFTIALAGGETPRRLYQLLASPPYERRIAWDGWHVFWGDERCVPPDHQDSNYRMASEALLDRVPIRPDHIHRMRGEATPQAAAEDYEEELRQVFLPRSPVLDLILLGIGEDGHTASLLPETDALQEERRLVVANWVPRLKAYRITFTLPLINVARVVAFIVTGESKADALRNVLQPPPGIPLPAALVRPVSGKIHWFLTRAAASQLREIKV